MELYKTLVILLATVAQYKAEILNVNKLAKFHDNFIEFIPLSRLRLVDLLLIQIEQTVSK